MSKCHAYPWHCLIRNKKIHFVLMTKILVFAKVHLMWIEQMLIGSSGELTFWHPEIENDTFWLIIQCNRTLAKNAFVFCILWSFYVLSPESRTKTQNIITNLLLFLLRNHVSIKQTINVVCLDYSILEKKTKKF